MLSPQRPLSGLLPLFALLLANPVSAQGAEYGVTVLGKVPGSYQTYARGINDHGVVVGTALFIPGGLKAWTWEVGAGFALLPQPPQITDHGAVDINDHGDIAGDGGGDGGQIWRYTAGTYEMLGTLPGLPIPRAAGISASGTVAGTCLGTLFYTPHHSFVAEPGMPMVSILDNSYANDINGPGQVTGSAPGSIAYRYTPGTGVELLPALGGRFLTSGYALNDLGHVVGVAASTAEHSGVPFLYTETKGMQEIGSFGGRAFASGVNDSDEVIGEWEPASTRIPWVWSESRGVRFLNDVIPAGPGVVLHNVVAINDMGQICCRGIQNSEFVDVLLTPHVPVHLIGKRRSP